MSTHRINVSPRMKALLRYAKFAGPPPRLLVLYSQYWLDRACLNAAQRMGWEVRDVPVRMEGAMPREMLGGLFEAIAEFKPDFILSVNLGGMDVEGLLAEILSELEIPLVTWFVDDPRTILMGRTCYASPYSVALTWEAGYEDYLRACGFPMVATLPLACDDTMFNAPPGESWELPPTFVGNSMIEFAGREWEWFAAHPELAIAVTEAFERGLVTRERFRDGVRAMMPDAGALDAEAERHIELYCFIEGTRRLRADFARGLAPHGVIVCGDAAWGTVTAGVAPYVHYANDLASHYRRCPVNLNSTSIQMATAVNQRVFDCPAAGGFLITDAQASLGELFDVANEVVAYRSVEECAALLNRYRNDDAGRTRIVEAARKRILGEHTYRHRLERIVTLLRGYYA